MRKGGGDEEIVTSVVNRLSEALAEKEWTLTELADMTDLPYRTLRRIMRRDSNPPLEVAVILSRALDVPLEHLFSLEVAEQPVRR
jgi:transcriptional regulator with XRE-family HTH domain